MTQCGRRILTHHNIPESQSTEHANSVMGMKVEMKMEMLGAGHQTIHLQAID